MKAILIFDMPDKCSKCPLYVEGDRTRDFCSVTNEYFDGGVTKRGEKCPLKEVSITTAWDISNLCWMDS